MEVNTMNNMNNAQRNNKSEGLSLNIIVKDDDIIKYLEQYESPQREEKALEALKVGVIAILSASPSLDTKVVDEKFNQIEKEIKDYTNEFRSALADDLKKYFEKEKGDVPLAINSFLGEGGSLSSSLKNYFDPSSGKIILLLKHELGDGSEFRKALDPNNKESVISRIENVVEKKLSETIGELSEQFSLDKQDSGMSRVKKLFDDKVSEIEKTINDFFAQAREHLGMEKGRAEAAEKGTQKGRDFETVLYEDKVALLGQQLEDATENVTGSTGKLQRCKTGDYIITLGETSGAPGKRIVIEAKTQSGYKLKDAIEELKQAKENREAECGIFVFAKGCEPAEMGDFKIDGNDFFCTVDIEELQQKRPAIFLEAAYKISRVYVITQVRKEKKGKIDLSVVKGNIERMLDQVKAMADIVVKARTIESSGVKIRESAETIQQELETVIQSTLVLLK